MLLSEFGIQEIGSFVLGSDDKKTDSVFALVCQLLEVPHEI